MLNVVFESKLEKYFYAIYILRKLLLKYPNSSELEESIENIQIEIENHQKNEKKVEDVLSSLKNLELDEVDKKILKHLKKQLVKKIELEPCLEAKWENILGRRFESELQIAILQNPTEAMKKEILKVSNKITEILDEHPRLRKRFLNALKNRSRIGTDAFGSFSHVSTYGKLKRILENNNDLASVMYIHYTFAHSFSRKLKKENKAISDRIAFISNKKFYKSKYYSDRGRLEKVPAMSNTMGIMTKSRTWYQHKLPQKEVGWVADAKTQMPNLNSLYTRGLLDQEIPYVAGPSGMTSLFMGQALGFEVLRATYEKQLYMAAVSGHIVAGGLHSLHEVLGPIAFCLPEEKLLPEYLHSQNNNGEQGNYHVFYETISRIDPSFKQVIKIGWDKTNGFFEETYLKQPSQNRRLPSYEFLSKPLKEKILEGILNYGKRPKGFFTYTLNVDKQRGLIRAHNYKVLSNTHSSPLVHLIIAHAILSSPEGPTLKKYVASSLGFFQPTEACNYIKTLLDKEVEKFITYNEAIKVNQVNQAVQQLFRLSDNKKAVTKNEGIFNNILDRFEPKEDNKLSKKLI